MTTKRIDVCLPTEDRSRAHAFYSRGLGFQTPGGLGHLWQVVTGGA